MSYDDKLNSGWITVISGPMFTNKTETLENILEDFVGPEDQKRGRQVHLFVPATDTRHNGRVVSHNGRELIKHPSIHVKVIQPGVVITPVVVDAKSTIVAYEEAQFFNAESLLRAVEQLSWKGVTVIVVGLDRDSEGRPFGAMPDLLFMADEIIKTHGKCAKCGRPASRTQRCDPDTAQVHVGDDYELSCKFCLTIPC